MKRREPPLLATWMLEHLSSGDRDEALSGDLLEVFRSGRSNSWYWRQVCGACAVSWFNSLRARFSLFVFALAWSMLAPAWTAFIDRIENTSHLYGQLRQMDWPFSILSEFAAWIGLNLIFLWTGILLFFLLQPRQTRALGRRTTRGAFLKALGFLPPAYFATFVLMNLFAYPGLVIDRGTVTPWREIIDLRLWADALRVPYLVTLIGALWNAVTRSRYGSQPFATMAADVQEESAAHALPRLDPFSLTKFLGLMVAAGLINSMITGVLLCRLPDTHAPDLASLFVTATIYVLIGALAGIVGSWLYWMSPSSPFRKHSPLPFPKFALVCAAGWVWVTPMVLLAEQVSPATAFAAMIGTFILSTGMRSETYPALVAARSAPPRLDSGDLFAESTYRAPLEPHGYIIAIGLYAAAAAIYVRSNYAASMWIALSTAVFAWKKTVPRNHARADTQGYRRAALRLALVAIPAVFVTAWAMLDGIAGHNRVTAEQAAASDARQKHGAKTVPKTNSKASALGSSGYESLILWPSPPRKDLIAPVPVVSPQLAPGTTQPLVLRFDGSYEYMQPPDKRPGPAAHHARGTPLGVDIKSTNQWPVMMDAHQDLAAPIPTARCREIDVEIQNGDNLAGVVSLGLLLADGLPGQEQTAYLGEQMIVSTEPDHFYAKAAPISETVRFAVPRDVKLAKFSEITVLMLPDVEHMFTTPKIAIREFRFMPR